MSSYLLLTMQRKVVSVMVMKIKIVQNSVLVSRIKSDIAVLTTIYIFSFFTSALRIYPDNFVDKV